jgi:hypothetical protein
VVQLVVVTAIMPGVMLYAAPVWGGVCVGTGATERDIDRLSSVWDGVLRSVFGCARYGIRRCTDRKLGGRRFGWW